MMIFHLLFLHLKENIGGIQALHARKSGIATTFRLVQISPTDLFINCMSELWYLQIYKLPNITRLSSEWQSGRSMTAHTVLDLHSPIWGFGGSCTIYHFTANKCVLKCALYTFFSISNHFGCNLKGDNCPTVWGSGGHMCQG